MGNLKLKLDYMFTFMLIIEHSKTKTPTLTN